jgi:hypothetical protein
LKGQAVKKATEWPNGAEWVEGIVRDPAGTRVISSAGFAKLALAALALVGSALIESGCSTGTGFPAVHDMPAARTETTLTPAEVKQATDSLVSEREHLNSEAQSPGNAQPVAATNAPTTTGSTPQKKGAASAQPAAQQSSSSVNAYAKQ